MIRINPGALKYKIGIYRIPRAIAGGRYKDGDPELVCRMFAAVRGVKGSDQTLRDAEVHVETVEFTVRWREGLDSAMRVKWQEKWYEIERLEPSPYQRLYRRIWATSTAGAGGG